MTSIEAKKFNYYSAKNAEILTAICPKCQPYKDWFTFKRWLAQGETVAKNQHGSRIYVIIEKEVTNTDGSIEKVEFKRMIPVFCRHQLA